MEEDRKDAIEAGVTVADPDVDDDDKDVMLDEIEEETVEEQIEVAPMVVEYPPDPPAVQSVRSALEKLKGQDEAINMLILIADKLERMANAHCGKKHWKRIRYGLVSPYTRFHSDGYPLVRTIVCDFLVVADISHRSPSFILPCTSVVSLPLGLMAQAMIWMRCWRTS